MMVIFFFSECRLFSFCLCVRSSVLLPPCLSTNYENQSAIGKWTWHNSWGWGDAFCQNKNRKHCQEVQKLWPAFHERLICSSVALMVIETKFFQLSRPLELCRVLSTLKWKFWWNFQPKILHTTLVGPQFNWRAPIKISPKSRVGLLNKGTRKWKGLGEAPVKVFHAKVCFVCTTFMKIWGKFSPMSKFHDMLIYACAV